LATVVVGILQLGARRIVLTELESAPVASHRLIVLVEVRAYGTAAAHG
jgi:hypothetical protein